MQATADSSTSKRNSAVITPGNSLQDEVTIWLPSKVNKRWPAIIFAANRTDKVIGRIMFLIISMITIKGISAAGVPIGTKWARKSVILLIILNIMNLNQKGKANERVIAKCLVDVKVKEKSPRVLLKRISKNRDEKIKILIFLFFNRVVNSLFILEIIFLIRIL